MGIGRRFPGTIPLQSDSAKGDAHAIQPREILDEEPLPKQVVADVVIPEQPAAPMFASAPANDPIRIEPAAKPEATMARQSDDVIDLPEGAAHPRRLSAR